jgi:hypothetical protein
MTGKYVKLQQLEEDCRRKLDDDEIKAARASAKLAL